jgi:indoleamine 2,3-dioxygenase
MPIAKLLIPNLSDYGVDPIRGFLPNPSPLKALPSYYYPWENIMAEFNSLLTTGRLRDWVEKVVQELIELPLLEVDVLITKPMLRRAHSILTFIAHGYLYGIPSAEEPIVILPKSVAVPWFNISRKLKINPIISYSAVGLWNFKLIDESEPIDLR